MSRTAPRLVLFLLATACADGPSAGLVEAYCSTTCNKLAECELTGNLSADACIETCETSTSEPTCEISQAESDACLDAYEAATCDELRVGSPDACQQTCDTPDSGTPDSGTPDSGTPDSGTPAPTGVCAELQACCDQLDELTASVCQLVVDAGFAAGCGPALEGYVAGNQCDP